MTERVRDVVWRGVGAICVGALAACAPGGAAPTVRRASLAAPELGAEVSVAPDSFTRAPGFKYVPRVAARDDGFLVSWLRSPIAPPEDQGGVYVTRVDLQGQVLDAAQIKVSTDPGSYIVAGEGTQHAAVSANDRGYVLVYEIPNALHSSFIDTGGNLVAHDVSVASTQPHNIGPRPEVSWDGAHHLVVWQDGADPDALAIRLNDDGTPADPAPFQLSTARAEANFPQVAWTGSQHLVTWKGLSAGFVARRVSPDGSLPDAAPVNVPIATVGDKLAMCGPAGGSALVAWMQGTNAVQAVTLDSAATVGPASVLSDSQAAVWTPTVGCSGSRIVAAYPLYVPAILGWDLRMAARDLSTSAAVTNGSVSVTASRRWYPSIGCGPSRCLLTWVTGGGDPSNPTTTGLDVHGVLTDNAGTVLGADTLISTDMARRSEPVACWDGTRYLAVWIESSERYPSQDAAVYGGWLDATGAPQPGRIAVASGTGFRHTSAVACGSQGALVAWIDDPDSTTTADNVFHIRRIGADGTPGATATPASPGIVSRQQNAVVVAGNDVFLVAWLSSGRLSAAVVGPSWNGEALAPLILTTQAASNALAAIWDGENFLVSWGQGTAILGVRVRPDGTQVDPAPVTFANGTFDALNLGVAASTDRTMLLWINTFSTAASTQNNMGGALLDHGGQVLGTFQIPLASADRSVETLRLAWNGASYVASWLASDPINGVSAHMIRLTPGGIDADPTSIVIPDAVEPADPVVAGDGNGHVLLFYSEINPNTTAGQTRVVSRRVTSGSLDGVGVGVDGGDAAAPGDAASAEHGPDSGGGADAADGTGADAIDGSHAADAPAGADATTDAGSGGCNCAAGGPGWSGEAGSGGFIVALIALASRRRSRTAPART